MLDTNVLISLIFFPNEQMNKLKTMICNSHSIVLCSYIIEELQNVVARKFPSKKVALDTFLESLPYEFVYTPKFFEISKYPSIRDKKDMPVLVTSILEDVDILLTGDADFSSVKIDRPKIMTPSEFIKNII
jgi:putative PIN family toxin of toxin-antitoxin system